MLAHAAIDGALARGLTPVVVGGSGLYLRAALADLELPPPPAEGAREQWERLYDDKGSEVAHALLADRDPTAASRVHPNDRKRVVRALELSEAGASLAPVEDALWSERYRHPTQVFGFEVPREELDRRIEARSAAMFDKGAVEEVERAQASRLSHDGGADHRPPRDCRAPGRRGSRGSHRAYEAARRVPAQVDAPHSRSC